MLGARCSTQEIFNHLTTINPISSFSNENISFYEPYAYQAVTELGAPAYETGYLKGLLKKINPDATGNPNYELLAPAELTDHYLIICYKQVVPDGTKSLTKISLLNPASETFFMRSNPCVVLTA